MRIVNGDPAACGIAMRPTFRWSAGGGYSALRPGIPLFGFRIDADPRQTEAFNYVYSITNEDFTAEALSGSAAGRPVGMPVAPAGGCDPALGRPVVVAHTPS